MSGSERALAAMLCSEAVLSLTYARGLEWMRHGAIAAAFGGESYFCLPCHSWQKGGVENMNGLRRRYLPKGVSFPSEEMHHEWLRGVDAERDGCPRRLLGCRTPAEVARESRNRSV